MITEASSNIVLSQRSVLINNLKGKSITTKQLLSFDVRNDAPSNQKVFLSGKVILPGNKYQAQRVETFTVSGTTIVNPKANIAYNFDRTPQIVTRWRNNTIMHNLDLEVSPAVESLPAGYTVSLKPVGPNTGGINTSRTVMTQNTGSLGRGQVKKIRFTYSFWIKWRNKPITLEVTYSHRGEVVKKDTLTVTPY